MNAGIAMVAADHCPLLPADFAEQCSGHPSIVV
jgi:hypothetical protein